MTDVTSLTGFRRDILYVLHDTEEANGLQIKDELQAKADRYIEDNAVYEALNSLSDNGLVVKERNGRENRYSLTDEGREQLVEHHRWASQRM